MPLKGTEAKRACRNVPLIQLAHRAVQNLVDISHTLCAYVGDPPKLETMGPASWDRAWLPPPIEIHPFSTCYRVEIGRFKSDHKTEGGSINLGEARTLVTGTLVTVFLPDI